jgi:hypothetical protein
MSKNYLIQALLSAGAIGYGVHGIKQTDKVNKVLEDQVKKEIKINQRLPKVPKDIKLLKTKKDLHSYIDLSEKTDKKRKLMKQIIGPITKKPNAFAFVPDNESAGLAVYIPDNMKASKVVAHELGHIEDFKKHNVKGTIGYNKLINTKKSLFKGIISPKKTSVYSSEVRAWDNAKIKKDDPLRVAALKTYEENLKIYRRTIPILLGVGNLYRLGFKKSKW